jgi:hypothetical protein
MYRVLFATYRKEGTSAEDHPDSHIPITRRFAGLRHCEVLPAEGAVR